MGADMAELIRDRDDKNQIRWKVIRSDGKVIVITTNEDVADTYYQKSLTTVGDYLSCFRDCRKESRACRKGAVRRKK